MNQPKLQKTRDYSKFVYSQENRTVEMNNLRPQHKKLRESMRKHGFLFSFPIMAANDGDRLVIKDGQHRFTFAKEFGLDVYYVVDNTPVCIADINGAQASWKIDDYAKRFAATGNQHYMEALEFSRHYGISVSQSFSMLAGTASFGNISDRFRDGRYQVRYRDLAHRAGNIYRSLTAINPKVKNQMLVKAIWSCVHVDYFDESRVITTAQKRPDLLIPCGKYDAAIQMMENLYNHGRKHKEPLRFDAEKTMATRKATFGREGKRAES